MNGMLGLAHLLLDTPLGPDSSATSRDHPGLGGRAARDPERRSGRLEDGGGPPRARRGRLRPRASWPATSRAPRSRAREKGLALRRRSRPTCRARCAATRPAAPGARSIWSATGSSPTSRRRQVTRIEPSDGADPPTVRFAVSDTGPGIPEGRSAGLSRNSSQADPAVAAVRRHRARARDRQATSWPPMERRAGVRERARARREHVLVHPRAAPAAGPASRHPCPSPVRRAAAPRSCGGGQPREPAGGARAAGRRVTR